ncbi:MAG: N-formylglutamate amidohydrolase [bacterium]|nr:N-formylglutamate amidohydrolase [bacterium]
MKLPLLISVPHAGTMIPLELEQLNLLTADQIVKDGDEGAREIYDIEDQVAGYVTTEIARAYLDMNRAESDRSADGVVKTETIYQESIYRELLEEKQIQQLLSHYYRPYHRKLVRLSKGQLLGIDCHTMASEAPPISTDAGSVRPLICLSDAEGTCPKDWTRLMAKYLEASFECTVSINHPFKGGYIIRSHSSELPWMQLELSRSPFDTLTQKKEKVLRALTEWSRCQK